MQRPCTLCVRSGIECVAGSDGVSNPRRASIAGNDGVSATGRFQTQIPDLTVTTEHSEAAEQGQLPTPAITAADSSATMALVEAVSV